MIKNLMVQKSKLLLILVIIFVIPMASFASDVEFPMVQSFSYFPYIRNNMLSNGDSDFLIDVGYSNIYMFNYDRDVVNDFEFGNVTIAFRKSLLRNLNIEFYLRTGVIYGGVMDKLIVDFHKLIGNGEDGRDEFPRNTVNYRNKDVFSYSRSMFAAGPFIAGILTRLYEGKEININFRASLGIPLQEKAGVSTGKPFITTGFIFSYKRNMLAIDMSVYGSFYKIPEWYDPEEVRSRMFFFNIHGAYKKILGGLLFRSTPFRYGDLSNPAYQIYFGYKISDSVSIVMYEEIPPMDTVSDVTFRLIFEF